jgi:hypothetical protein
MPLKQRANHGHVLIEKKSFPVSTWRQEKKRVFIIGGGFCLDCEVNFEKNGGGVMRN